MVNLGFRLPILNLIFHLAWKGGMQNFGYIIKKSLRNWGDGNPPFAHKVPHSRREASLAKRSTGWFLSLRTWKNSIYSKWLISFWIHRTCLSKLPSDKEEQHTSLIIVTESPMTIISLIHFGSRSFNPWESASTSAWLLVALYSGPFQNLLVDFLRDQKWSWFLPLATLQASTFS